MEKPKSGRLLLRPQQHNAAASVAYFYTALYKPEYNFQWLHTLESFPTLRTMFPTIEYATVGVFTLTSATISYQPLFKAISKVGSVYSAIFFTLLIETIAIVGFLSFWASELQYWSDGRIIPTLLALLGFLSISIVAPLFVYGFLRTPPAASLEKIIPKGFRSDWAHSVQTVVGGGWLLFYCRLFLYLAFPYAFNNHKEPVYWHATPNSRQRAMIAFCTINLVSLVLRPVRPRKAVYFLWFFYGPAVAPYCALWIVHLLQLFSPVFLAITCLVWGIMSSLHAMAITHRLFFEERQAFANWFPRAFRQAVTEVRDIVDLEDRKVRRQINATTHFIFAVLVTIYLTFLDLGV